MILGNKMHCNSIMSNSAPDQSLVLHVLLALSMITASTLPADDKPAVPPVKHRVVGLFSPDRQDDLREVMTKLPEVKLMSIDYKHAEAEFAYDAEKLFNRPNPEQLIERFDNLLRSHSAGTFGIKPLCTTPKDKLMLIEIPVLGIDCKGCSLAAYEAISGIEGLAQATVSFKESRVTALIDPEKTNRAAVEEALQKKGVEVVRSK